MFLIGASDGRGETTAGDAAASNGLVEITRNPDGSFSAAFRWSAKRATSTFGSPIVARSVTSDGDRALFVNRAGVLFQLDLESGEELSADRTDAGGIWATPLIDGDHVYLFGYKGTTSVFALTGVKESTGGEERYTNRCWPPAASETSFGGGNVLYAAAAAPPYLFVRRGDKLYAIKSSKQAVAP
jgi:hypothetical protein